MTTKIEWTDETWNPVTGCTRVSKGCDNCYAVRQTKRLAAIDHTREKYSGLVNEGKDHFNGTVMCHEDELDRPLSWQKPRRIFVCSMADLFHPEVPDEFIDKVFAVMALCPQHTFQVLTKRPERMKVYLTAKEEEGVGWLEGSRMTNSVTSIIKGIQQGDLYLGEKFTRAQWGVIDYPEDIDWPLPNVWLGTSVEDQETADDRIPHLLKCPAAVRFLSCEPLLGEIDLITWLSYYDQYEDGRIEVDHPSISWVIVGGESGPNARAMHPYWVRSIRDQCADAGVPFFFKQWGSWLPTHVELGEPLWKHGGPPSDVNDYERQALDISTDAHRVGKKKAGRVLDGETYEQFPEQKDKEVKS